MERKPLPAALCEHLRRAEEQGRPAREQDQLGGSCCRGSSTAIFLLKSP